MAGNTSAERTTQDYYDSQDADNFYEKVWGGEDIHIGLYQDGMDIREASHLTVSSMEAMLKTIHAGSRVLDLGAGYGGAARYLATTIGCHVTCLNLSEVQNQRNKELTKAAGLNDKVEVVHGSFESIPAENQQYDVIWSQDSFLHSNKRSKVMDEIQRVLKPGGELIFTDPMQADNCPEGVLQPVYDRLNLTSLASFRFYRETLKERGFKEETVYDFTHQLRTHYSKVRQSLVSRYDELSGEISTVYLDKMIKGLENWVKAADQGYLAWGIMHFSKT